MKNIFKGLGLGLMALALVMTMGVGSANAALTLGALTATSDGALTLNGAAASVLTIGHASQTAAITIGATASSILTALNIGTGDGVKTAINIGTGAGANGINIGGAASTTTIGGTLILGDTSTFATAAVLGTGANDILTSIKLTPLASVANASASLRHVLVSVGEVSGSTAFGFGDPAVSNTGLMASFGRTVIATTGSLTDTGLDARMINNVDNSGTTLYSMQGAYIKAKNYSLGVVDVLKGLSVEAVNDGTATTSHVLYLGTDGTTLTDLVNMGSSIAAYGIDMNDATLNTADIRLQNGNTITNSAAGTTVITGNISTGGVQSAAYAATATAEGLTTGLIPAGTSYVTVTSAGANNIVTLPAPVVGNVIRVYIGANGVEVRTVAASNVKINDVDADGGAYEAALPATTLATFTAVSASEWVLTAVDKLGAVITAIVPDAV